jgi:hypothetical protein
MVNYSARRQPLEGQFFAQLADQGDTVQYIHRNINIVLHPNHYACCDPQDDGQMPPTSHPDSALLPLTTEQYAVAFEII